MTDRTKVNISKNMTICCENCLNDDPWCDIDSSCFNCEAYNGKFYYFLGLKEDKRYKNGYRVILSPGSELKNENITAKDLLERIETEKQMRAQTSMFGGLTLEGVYD